MSDLTVQGQTLSILNDIITLDTQVWTADEISAPDGGGVPIATVLALSRTAAGSADVGSGQFYTDTGALAGRFADRLFVGAATDNAGAANRDQEPRDWLSEVLGPTNVGAWPVWGAQGASLARFGSIGWLGASRTSDAKAAAQVLGYNPSSIGIAAFAVADDTTNPTNSTATGVYSHAIRQPGVNYQPTFAAEFEVVNAGGAAIGVSTPYHINTGGGTYCLQAGSGGGQTNSSDADAVITVVTNPKSFKKGIVFQSGALSGTDGTALDTGFGSAMSMGRMQGFEWYSPDGSSACILRSTVTQATLGSRFEFQDGGPIFVNSTGYGLLSISNLGGARPYNTLQFFASSAVSLPAGIQVQALTGSNGNLALRPSQGATLDITAPIGHYGASIPATANAGLVSIVVNGVTVLIPMFLPSQIGT